ncbi:MAG: hypothetical protein HFI77_11915 [Lachnospiraceae bacterium]|nr:hypothetical protein [Lachnospiraceae bacterium]
MKLYPQEQLFQEMAFISYYFHWSDHAVLSLEHAMRRRWCMEISEINKSLSPSKEEKENIWQKYM